MERADDLWKRAARERGNAIEGNEGTNLGIIPTKVFIVGNRLGRQGAASNVCIRLGKNIGTSTHTSWAKVDAFCFLLVIVKGLIFMLKE